MAQDSDRSVGRLRKLIDEGRSLQREEIAQWRERARLAVAAAYGNPSDALTRFDRISYTLPMWTDRTPESAFAEAQRRGLRQAIGMLEAFVEDLDETQAVDARPGSPGGKQVFVVHGRDVAVREQVARFLEHLELEPILLWEQPDRGRTVLEKFEEHALEVGYAVILLTPDDYGRGPDDPDWPSEPNRARQNVILELGYFMGALGRAQTAALYVDGTELPSDIHGLLYIPFDESWRVRLAKEMRDAGLPIDLNRL